MMPTTTENTLDAMDWRVLDILQTRGRTTNLELSQSVHLSAAQTHRRHRRLEAMGIIKGYEARLDATALGLGVTAFVHVTMAPNHAKVLTEFRQGIQRMAEILSAHAVSGDTDYVLVVVARDLKALSEVIMSQIMLLPGVNSVRSTVCLEEVKSTHALPLPKV